jgi:hypothetical protein
MPYLVWHCRRPGESSLRADARLGLVLRRDADPPLDTVATLAMIIEWPEQLLVRERELDSRENALMAQEDDLAITKRALGLE